MNRIKLARDLAKAWFTMSLVNIRVWGGPAERRIYDRMNSRHPKFPLFRLKAIGVALLELPDTPEAYRSGPDRRLIRNRVNKAVKAGYRFSTMDPGLCLEEIMEVNLSNTSRQGGELPTEYTDREEVLAWSRQDGDYFCVKDADGKVVAYLYGLDIGEVFAIQTIIGHHAHLQQGVVWLLIRETVNQCIARRSSGRSMRWVMYDMYLGAMEGLRFFKQQLGFVPHKVKWEWVDTPPVAPVATTTRGANS